MVSVVLIRYYNMLWRIQPILGLEMGVSYVWVASVVVCAFVYLTCMGMGVVCHFCMVYHKYNWTLCSCQHDNQNTDLTTL